MNLPILDVAIGITFTYLLLALICTTVSEAIAGWFKTRSAFLDRGIDALLHGNVDLKQKLLAHPLISSLSADGINLPSYIPAGTFATVLMDILSGPGNSRNNVEDVRAGIRALMAKDGQGNVVPHDALQTALLAVLDIHDIDPAKAKAAVEQWFNRGMERVTGWYKRNRQVWVLCLSAGVTIAFNADTVQIARTLWVSPTIRATIVEQAKARAEMARPQGIVPLVEYRDANDPTAPSAVGAATGATGPSQGAAATAPDGTVPTAPAADSSSVLTPAETKMLDTLTGWTNDTVFVKDWKFTEVLERLFGWLLTALAVSLGAPFWFDTLNRFVNIRSAGRNPDEQKKDGSQAPAA